MSAPITPARAAPRAFVLGDDMRWRFPGRIDLTCLAIIAAVIAIPLRGLYASTGSTMEEGFMLVFPERLVAGDVPNVDFLHLYGPASLDVLAGWYGLFGHSLASERTFGLLQHVGIIFAVYALTRAWGHIAATACAVACTLLVLTPIGLSALGWEGGVALGLWSVVFAARSYNIAQRQAGQNERGPQQHSSARRNLVIAGLLAGLALCFRPDLIIALGLAHGWLLVRRREWRGFAAGVGIGVIPFVVHLFRAGISASVRGMVLDPVFYLRPGRELPRPPSWSVIDGALQAVAEGPPPWWHLPAISASHQLFIWFFLMLIVAVFNVIVALIALRRGRHQFRAITLMVGSLFGLGLVPQGLQRPDSTHLAWATCIGFALLPVSFIELAEGRLTKLSPRPRAVLAGSMVFVLFFAVCPFFTYRSYLLQTRVAVGNKPVPFEVQRNGRQFWMGEYHAAKASNDLISDLAKMSKPGERLLVGPADLSRTIYSDVMFYYMFPELKPATYFIEMDPGLADKEGSSLAADVQSANWVVLSNLWTGWKEPNASSRHGSQAPNRVVADHFCLVGQYEKGLMLLYHRCAKGDGISPADIGEPSARQRAAGG